MQDAPLPRKTARWRYVVPNAITLCGLVLGLAATMQGMEGHTLDAAWLVILCVLIDKLDGTAARLLKATSPIGVQLDSFSDFVTFGIAPGALIYSLTVGGAAAPDGPGQMWHGDVTSIVAHVLVTAYILAAVVRLAKFNVLADDDLQPKKPGVPGVFYGIPSTFAGGMVAILAILGMKYGVPDLLAWLPVIGAVLAALMVSNIPLPKVGRYDNKLLNAYQLFGAVAAYVCGIARVLPELLAFLVGTYLIGGLIWGMLNRAAFAPDASLDPYPQ